MLARLTRIYGSGLKMYWPMKDAADSLTILDSSGLSNNGSVGAGFVFGESGIGDGFTSAHSGVASAIVTPTSMRTAIDWSDSFTVGMYVNFDNLTTKQGLFSVFNGPDWISNISFSIAGNTANDFMAFIKQNGVGEVGTPGRIDVTGWCFITMSFNISTGDMITSINGAPAGIVNTAYRLPSGVTHYPNFGNGQNGVSPVKGKIAHLFAVNRASLASEIKQLYYPLNYEGGVIVRGDDARKDQYDNMFPILQDTGVRATIYAHTGSMNGMSMAQLKEMYDWGCDAGNHTYTHDDLDSITLQQGITSITNCKNDLDNAGMDRASRHLAYPHGRYGSPALDAMAGAGMLTGTTCMSDTFTKARIHDLYTPYKIPIFYVYLATPKQLVIDFLDALKYNGVTGVILYHTITAPGVAPAVEFEHAGDDFADEMQHIKDIGLRDYTISEWYNEYSGAYA